VANPGFDAIQLASKSAMDRGLGIVFFVSVVLLALVIVGWLRRKK
jgi:hypothetical protein